jgi:chemotaxis family two-component system sensor kinase Cph1
MSHAQDPFLADEELRMRECAREPIHVPGAIQPHGALLGVDPDSLIVIQASDNCEDVLGVSASSLLGIDIGTTLGAELTAFLHDGFHVGNAPSTHSILATVNSASFDVITHVAGDVGIVEFEPVARIDGRAFLTRLHATLKRLSSAAGPGELRRMAAHELRALTGFDQVMVYHFHPDGHGEVMADDHADGMTPYCGLHFPASDIPAQARRLYNLKGSGLIASSQYRPAKLLASSEQQSGDALDLSRAELRSVSPHHLEFMYNMGQAASFTLSLAINGELVGLITCAHRQPRRVPFVLRQMCEVLAQQVVLQLDAMTRMQAVARQMNSNAVRKTLVEQMTTGREIATGLINHPTSILDLVTADGAAVCRNRRITSVGKVPSVSRAMVLLTALTQKDGTIAALQTESLRADRPDLAALVPGYAGVFVQPFGNADDCLVWYRQEIAGTIEWLGPQSSDNRLTPLSPRTSFARWRETVEDRSDAWDRLEIAGAAELGRDIDQVLLRRTQAQLAHVALHDSLTGLPNRRLLIDRISAALTRTDRGGEELGILFCDLDDFKRVNDTAGHAAGDAVLIEAATRLQSVLRVGDSIARVGGDEFVVVLETSFDRELGVTDTDRVFSSAGTSASALASDGARGAAIEIAERITAELTRPIRWRNEDHVISVSIGIAFALPGSAAEELLQNADAAMYRAKQTGRNCVAIFDDSLRADILEPTEAEYALRNALAPEREQGRGPHPRIVVDYQPMIDIDSGRLFGFEAQLSVTHGDGHRIALSLLKNVAGRAGLVAALGERVLETSIAALAEWRSRNPSYTATLMAVAFSSVGLVQHGDLPTLVEAALERHGLRPSDLGLEITDSALITPGSAALRQFTRLHDRGVGIAINDFGTGHANLHHLANLPVDAIKVDASFTAGLPGDAISVTIVRAIAGLAADMNLACIFAGIDTDAQMRALPPGVIGLGLRLGAPTRVPTYVAGRGTR